MPPRVLLAVPLAALSVACGDLTQAPPVELQNLRTPPALHAVTYAGQTTTAQFTVHNDGTRPATYTVGFIEPAVYPGPISSWLHIGPGGQGKLYAGERATVELRLSCPATPESRTAQLEVWTDDADASLTGPRVTLECREPE